MTKRYLKAINSLYGDLDIINPEVAGISRSCGKTQPRKPRRNIEAGLQMKLVAWLWEIGKRPICIGNEGKRTINGHHRAKLMGLWPGASDLFLPYPRNGYAGYWIELKQPGEIPRANQVEFLDTMQRNGYFTGWFDNLAEVQASITEYLNGRV